MTKYNRLILNIFDWIIVTRQYVVIVAVRSDKPVWSIFDKQIWSIIDCCLGLQDTEIRLNVESYWMTRRLPQKLLFGVLSLELKDGSTLRLYKIRSHMPKV